MCCQREILVHFNLYNHEDIILTSRITFCALTPAGFHPRFICSDGCMPHPNTANTRRIPQTSCHISRAQFGTGRQHAQA